MNYSTIKNPTQHIGLVQNKTTLNYKLIEDFFLFICLFVYAVSSSESTEQSMAGMVFGGLLSSLCMAVPSSIQDGHHF